MDAGVEVPFEQYPDDAMVTFGVLRRLLRTTDEAVRKERHRVARQCAAICDGGLDPTILAALIREEFLRD